MKSAALTAAGLAAAGTASAQQTSGGRPNILLLMTDQHRGDCLGCDGNDIIQTPNLDRLASEGAHFHNGFSSTPTCTPARSGLLTGMSPWHHGMLGYGRVAHRYDVELPRAVRSAGYQTLGIGKMHWFPQRHLHGFHDTIVDESGREETDCFKSDYRIWFRKHAPEGMVFNETGIGWNSYRTAPYVPPEELHPTFWTAQVAVDYINQYNYDKPFFLKVSFARPHSPYDPPQRFWDAYSESDMPSRMLGDWCERYAPADPSNYTAWHGDLGDTQARKSRRGYYGSISFIDEQIGRILDTLEKNGMLDNTLIVMIADHGDMTGDHHLWRKSYAYDGSARVPFIVRPPMGMDTERGVSRPEVVELRDVLPTFLDAAGARIPGHLDGHSILGLLRGEGGWRDVIDLEHDVCYDDSNHWNAVTDGHYKYIYHAQTGEEQLFDLVNDPREEHDLAQESGNRSLVGDWRGVMIDSLRERGAPFVVNGDLDVRPERMLYSPNYPGAYSIKDPIVSAQT